MFSFTFLFVFHPKTSFKNLCLRLNNLKNRNALPLSTSYLLSLFDKHIEDVCIYWHTTIHDNPMYIHISSIFLYPKTQKPKRLRCTAATDDFEKYLSGVCRNEATIKCYSCVNFDKCMKGWYCDYCFQRYHPPQRIEHHYVSIDNDDDNLGYEMEKQCFR